MGVESIRCEGAKAGHDRGLHKLPVGTRGPVLPDSGNLGMDETVEGAVEVGTHRVAVAKPHGPQMLLEAIVQAAVGLTCVLLAAERTREDVHQVLGGANKMRPDHKRPPGTTDGSGGVYEGAGLALLVATWTGAGGKRRASSTDGSQDQEITEVGVTFESNEGWAREDFFEARVQLHQVEVAEQYVPDRQIVGVERQNSHCAIIFVTRSLGGENCRTWESTNTLQSCL